MAWSKESRQSRGYGAEWSRLRVQVIERDQGLCQMCLKDGRTTAGKEVDHKTPKAKAKQQGWSQARTDSLDNTWLLCTPCHKRKTTEEVGATYRPPQRIGVDGFPIEDNA